MGQLCSAGRVELGLELRLTYTASSVLVLPTTTARYASLCKVMCFGAVLAMVVMLRQEAQGLTVPATPKYGYMGVAVITFVGGFMGAPPPPLPTAGGKYD